MPIECVARQATLRLPARWPAIARPAAQRQERIEDFVATINADFGHRSRQETSLLEMATVVDGIKYLHHNLARWMRPEKRRVALHFRLGSARVVHQPLGVVGTISPWNYPAALALMPLATALAAGNQAMIKPSEFTPATAELMTSMLADAFQQDQVAVVTGDTNVGVAFSKLAFDHIFFTGSTPVGHTVMRGQRQLGPCHP
jgi:coniferyl-aldehyde dehydrogenase